MEDLRGNLLLQLLGKQLQVRSLQIFWPVGPMAACRVPPAPAQRTQIHGFPQEAALRVAQELERCTGCTPVMAGLIHNSTQVLQELQPPEDRICQALCQLLSNRAHLPDPARVSFPLLLAPQALPGPSCSALTPGVWP